MKENLMPRNEIFLIHTPDPPYNVAFSNKEGKQIGKLYWDNELKFAGNAEESALVFIKFLKELWNIKEK